MAAQGSGGHKLLSQGASNLPIVEDLVVTRWSSVILVNNQIQVRNLFVDRFCLALLAVWGADSQEQFTQIRSKNWPTNRSYTQLLGRAKKWLVDEVGNNQKQLRKVVHNCLANLINNCLEMPRTIENGYAKDWSCKQTKLQTTDQAIEVKRLIQERSYCNKICNLSESNWSTTNWPVNWPTNWSNTSTSISISFEFGLG